MSVNPTPHIQLAMADRRAFILAALATTATGCRISAPTVPSRAEQDVTSLPEPSARVVDRVESDALDQCSPGSGVEAPRVSRQINQLGSIAWASLSPDGETLLVRNDRELAFVPVNGGDVRVVHAVGPQFGVFDADQSLTWSSDSRGVWFLAGETTRAGFVAGPLRCARRLRDGRIVHAPTLRGLPGRLDQVTWVDGEGLGIAHLDTRGSYNRPQLPDPSPTLAVIEAGSGAVRSVLPLREAIVLLWGEARGAAYIQVLATTRLRDGRVRAILRCGLHGDRRNEGVGGVALWTEGMPLRPLPSALGEHLSSVVFTPSGETLLVSHHLSASGVIFEHGPSPPPTPVRGAYATLYDLNGDALWTLSGTANDIRGAGPLAVSPDGRRGLLALPETCGRSEVFGLVDLRRGKVVRRLSCGSGNRTTSAGFDGDRPWFTSYQRLDVFD